MVTFIERDFEIIKLAVTPCLKTKHWEFTA